MGLNLLIHGGHTINGVFPSIPSKNATLPAICAAFATGEKCTLRNVGTLGSDALLILDSMKDLGGYYSYDKEKGILIIHSKDVDYESPIPSRLGGIQAGLILAGPFLGFAKKCCLPVSTGGCQLGFRGYEGLVEYLGKVGVKTLIEDGHLKMTMSQREVLPIVINNQWQPTIEQIVMRQPRVVPTEALIILCAMTEGTFALQGIAREPHVQFLEYLLHKMGAQVQYDSGALIISGTKLKGFDCTIPPDEVNFIGDLSAVISTNGTGTFEGIGNHRGPRYLIDAWLPAFGIGCEITDKGILTVGPPTKLSDDFTRFNDSMYSLQPNPWPGMPVDCLPSFAVMALHASKKHPVRLNNWMYSNPNEYLASLITMGYGIEIETKQVAILHGPPNCPNESTVLCPPIIEATRAIINGALSCPSGSVIHVKDADFILRRNPNFVADMCARGAHIEIVD